MPSSGENMLPSSFVRGSRRPDTRSGRAALVAALVGASLLAMQTPRAAMATTFTWNGGGGANWNDTLNWGGVTPTGTTTDDLAFAGSTNIGTSASPRLQN